MDWADPVACCMQLFVADRRSIQTLLLWGSNHTQGIIQKSHKETFHKSKHTLCEFDYMHSVQE